MIAKGFVNNGANVYISSRKNTEAIAEELGLMSKPLLQFFY